MWGLHLGRQTQFLCKKLVTFFSHHRLLAVGSAVSSLFIFSWKLATFLLSLSHAMLHKFAAPFVGPLFCGTLFGRTCLNPPLMLSPFIICFANILGRKLLDKHSYVTIEIRRFFAILNTCSPSFNVTLNHNKKTETFYYTKCIKTMHRPTFIW